MKATLTTDNRLPQRFWDKIALDPRTGCWVWMASRVDGYGQYSLDGQMHRAHRVAWSALVGTLPPYASGGLQLDHLCHNRACVNPAHLELVTSRENTARGIGPKAAGVRARTDTGLCRFGHDTWRVRADGTATCRECHRDASRAQSRAVGAAAVEMRMTRRRYVATFGQSGRRARWLLDLPWLS